MGLQVVVGGAGLFLGGFAINNLIKGLAAVDELSASDEDKAALKGLIVIEWINNPFSTSISPTVYDKLEEAIGGQTQEYFDFVNQLDGLKADSTELAKPDDQPLFFQPLMKQKMDTAEDEGSPLILDIDGDGIELTSLASASAVYWDIDMDGFAEASGWVGPDDGLLAIDVNQDGIINNSGELFGDQTGYDNGFLALAQYDSNEDGLITAGDAAWADLLVWTDDNGDGYSQDSELHTMSDLLITEIDLGYSDVGYSISGNEIKQESTFTINGNTRDIVDAYFAYDDVNSIYAQSYVLDIDTLQLPIVRGSGTVPDLYIAMSLDNDDQDPDSLISLVSDLNDLTFSQIFDETQTLVNDVRDIMFRWAGVDGVDTTSRGPYIDARELEFIEEFLGEEFLQRGTHSDPLAWAADDLEEAFDIAFQNVYARLLAQAAGGELFTGDLDYDIASDMITGITGLDSTNLSALETDATNLANTAERMAFWGNVVRMIENAIGVSNLPAGDQTALDTAISNSDATLDTQDILDDIAYVPNDVGSFLTGDSGNNTLTGGADNDQLDGQGGDDILTGNGGGDYLLGGAGNDEYHYDLGDGIDAIRESGVGTGNDDDRVIFGTGIDSGDLTLTRANNDLVIDIDTGTQTGKIVIENQFNYAAGGGHVEWLEFSDASTYDLDGQSWTLNGTANADSLQGVAVGGLDTDTINGLAGNDTITGGTGDDVLDGGDGNDFVDGGADDDTLYGGSGDDDVRGQAGADVLYGGAGDDTLRGGIGDDVYHYVSGHDVIFEEGGTADEIQLDAVWNGSSPQYLKFGTDLQIWFDADNTITIDSYYASTGKKVETLKFQDTTTVDLSTVSTAQMGDDNNNNLIGTANDDVIFGLGGNDNVNAFSGSDGNDTLYGGAGNDVVHGGNGNDYLDGGPGDDDLRGGANNDTYIYSSGTDIFRESSGTDVVELVEGWTLEDITFRRDLTDHQDLQIIFSPVNSIRLDNQYQNADRFETLRFSDNSTINLLTLQVETHGNDFNNIISGIAFNGSNQDIMFGYAGNDTLRGYEGNDVLYGGLGNDVIYGGNGDDTIYGEAGGDDMRGEAGNDTYIFDGGLDKIIESGSDLGDVLKVTGGVTINDISMVDSGTVDAKMIVNSGVDEITLINLRGSGTWSRVETGEFDDGFTVDLRTYQSWINGTTSGETLNGTSGDDTLIGFAGDDTVNAGAGADAAHGGTGADTLHGGDGADLLHGGVGDDILYGEDGLDTLFGGTGADDFIFESATAFNNVDVVKDFSIAENDALDISDILDTVYDPLTDLITDFVQITDNGTDSTLSIDRDGTGATYSFDSVASILGVTGLTDEAALENSGHLITA